MARGEGCVSGEKIAGEGEAASYFLVLVEEVLRGLLFLSALVVYYKNVAVF